MSVSGFESIEIVDSVFSSADPRNGRSGDGWLDDWVMKATVSD